MRVVHGCATAFIPADTWISVVNTGSDVIHLVAVFSESGFEDFMRAVSVCQGEKNAALSKPEDEDTRRKHAHDVIYK